jgi:hypothetical protein
MWTFGLAALWRAVPKKGFGYLVIVALCCAAIYALWYKVDSGGYDRAVSQCEIKDSSRELDRVKAETALETSVKEIVEDKKSKDSNAYKNVERAVPSNKIEITKYVEVPASCESKLEASPPVPLVFNNKFVEDWNNINKAIFGEQK